MGWGSGYSSRTSRDGKSYSNDMVAHVWAAQSESAGHSGNGNFYFRGAALYSYGSHFLVGYIMPDGTALLNADSYSVSTSGHQSDAAAAVRHKPRLYVDNLTAFESLLNSIRYAAGLTTRDMATRDRIKREARSLILANAEALARRRMGAYRWNDSESEGETAGAYLTRVAGLPAATWPALAKAAAKAKAKAEREEAAANAKRDKESALRFADMPDSEFRGLLSLAGYNGYAGDYNARYRIGAHAKALFHAVRLAKTLGFSKRRRAVLSARHKAARDRLANLDSLFAIVNKRESIRGAVKDVRRFLAYFTRLAADVAEGDSSGFNSNAESYRYGAHAAANRLKDSAALPFVTRRRLAIMADVLADMAEPLRATIGIVRAAAYEAERAAREMQAAEHKAAWLRGDVPLGGRRFDAESGGAAIRIIGDRLETSHGATVPLAHAVRAFRFVKLCREAGRTWHKNGARIRVGAFEVDSVDAEGNMRAGCHDFTWPEIERAAALAGVADAEPSADAVENRAAA